MTSLHVDPSLTYTACPFCGASVTETDDRPYAYCATCRESVRAVTLPDQPDEDPQ